MKGKGINNPDDVIVIGRRLNKTFGPTVADLWLFGCTVDMRPTDLISLTVQQAKSALKSKYITGGKGDKPAKQPYRVNLSPYALSIIKRRLADNPDDVYLFQAVGKSQDTAELFSITCIDTLIQHCGKKRIDAESIGFGSMALTKGFNQHRGY